MKTLLLILGITLIITGITMAIVSGIINHLKNKKTSVKKLHKSTKTGIIIGSTMFIVALVFTILVPGNMYEVRSGELAVVKSYGAIVRTEKPGLHYKNPFSESYELYSTQIQQINIKKWCYVQDQTGTTQVVQVVATTQFYINENNATDIATKYGSLDTLKQRITTVILGVLETDAGQYRLENLVTGAGKTEYQLAVRNSLKATLDTNNQTIENRFYITFQEVTIEEFVLEEALESALLKVRLAEAARKEAEEKYKQETAAIEEKAKQDKIKADTSNAIALAKAENDIEVAKKNADTAVEKAKGDAAAKLAEAEGDAEAQKVIADALAYEIQALAEAEAEAIKTKLIALGYDPDSEEPVSDAILAYLKYLAYVNAWDGKLPEIVGGDLSLIIPVQP